MLISGQFGPKSGISHSRKNANEQYLYNGWNDVMNFIYTDGSNSDFIGLCRLLDYYLNEIAGGEENRLQYIPYNALDDIEDVILVYENEEPVGCAGFKYYDDKTAEVKRVFVKKEHRGNGISKQLMELLENKAKEKGFRILILESGEPLAEAMGLYHSIGFKVIENYGQYKNMPESICMEKVL